MSRTIPFRVHSDRLLKSGSYSRKSWASDGARWVFDEFVLGAPGKCAVHVEMMDARTAFVSVGDYRFSIRWTRGRAEVLLQEGPAR